MNQRIENRRPDTPAMRRAKDRILDAVEELDASGVQGELSGNQAAIVILIEGLSVVVGKMADNDEHLEKLIDSIAVLVKRHALHVAKIERRFGSVTEH